MKELAVRNCNAVTNAGMSMVISQCIQLRVLDLEGINGITIRLIADSCQHLKKLRLNGARQVYDDDDVIHVIKKLGKQLTTLELCGEKLTDFAYSYLNNCVR